MQTVEIPYLSDCPVCKKYIVRSPQTNIKNIQYYCKDCNAYWIFTPNHTGESRA